MEINIMMMFSEIAIAMELIAIASGVSLLIWSMRNEGAGVKIAKFFGYLISIFSILVILFSISAAIFRSYEMMSMMKNGCPMCQMMQQNMNGSKQTDTPGMMQNKEQKLP